MKRLILFLFLPILFFSSPSVVVAGTRLAVGSFGLSSEKVDGDLADIVAARLSNRPQLELVERRELNKVLGEATLSLTGLTKAKDAVRIGALLRVDQFLLGTTAPINGTNRMIVRLVDAQSGTIRAINVFPESPSLDTMAQNIIAFVKAEIERAPQSERDYLAIGTIQNLGVNNRFSNFPAQMRGSIAANLNGKITVLERDVISFLANEVRMNQSGLTEASKDSERRIQFGFWIVDGFYQSYEVADPELQLKLRVERVLGGKKSLTLQGKPDEKFLQKISETIEQQVRNPELLTNIAASPTRQGEIAALEERGRQLVNYRLSGGNGSQHILELRVAENLDKKINTLDEATRTFESILLLDPDNITAKMRLAACLLFDPMPVGSQRDHLAERRARARELYREVISTRDPENFTDAQAHLVDSYQGVDSPHMLHRLIDETPEYEQKKLLRRLTTTGWEYARLLPRNEIIEEVRIEILEELTEMEKNPPRLLILNLDYIFFRYFLGGAEKEQIINALLPELLQKFPRLKPHILLAALGEQIEEDSPVIKAFLKSLRECEEHPELVFQAKGFFSHLTFTPEDDVAMHSGWMYPGVYDRVFRYKHYSLLVTMALAHERAVERKLASPMIDRGKLFLARSYAALNEWPKAFDVYKTVVEVSVQEVNECRQHLKLTPQSEEVPESVWKKLESNEKVKMAFECANRQQWQTAIAILDSLQHRVIQMNGGGPWGEAFIPIFPALIANEFRVKAGKPTVKDPLRFELGDTPYLDFSSDDSRAFSFDVEGDDLWTGARGEIKRFRGAGPFRASESSEAHILSKSPETKTTRICVGPDLIWLATKNDGLFELDRKSGKILHFTTKEGLFLNSISDLHLRGQTLWMTYVNGENGAVGIFDLRTRKFSTFTPSLPAEAGANSQPRYNQESLDLPNQAPQLRIVAMTEGLPGEMCFIVSKKGFQFYSPDAGWKTKPGVGDLSTLGIDRDGNILYSRFQENTAYEETGAGLTISDRDNGYKVWRTIHLDEGLPSNEVTAIAVDGDLAWVGGRGFVAVVDHRQRKVLHRAYISANAINRIQLGKTYAWIQVGADAPGVARAGFGFNGNAVPGIYRIERASLEQSSTER